MKKQEKEKKIRGTIVVDSSALFYLAMHSGTPHKKQGFASNPPRYMDILYFLADHGYKIIIPEMVAYECAYMLADGRNVFNKILPEIPLSTSRETLQLAIREAIKHPNISIGVINHSWHTSEAFIFIKRVKDTVRKSQQGNVSEKDLNYAIRGFCKKDLGEHAAAKIIKTGPENTPYFFLSNDREGFHIVQRNSGTKLVGCLSINGLLQALKAESLWSESNFAEPHAYVTSVINDMEAKCSASQNKDMRGHLLEAIDTISHDLSEQDKPFSKTLDGLKQAIEVEADLKKTQAAINTSSKDKEESQRIKKEKKRLLHEKLTKDLEELNKPREHPIVLPPIDSKNDEQRAPVNTNHRNIQRFYKRWGQRVNDAAEDIKDKFRS